VTKEDGDRQSHDGRPLLGLEQPDRHVSPLFAQAPSNQQLDAVSDDVPPLDLALYESINESINESPDEVDDIRRWPGSIGRGRWRFWAHVGALSRS
jgi:hypothetical protein